MSIDKDQQPKIMTLHVFDDEDDTMLETIHNISAENMETVNFHYLPECVNTFGSKDTEINLTSVSMNSSSDKLHLGNFDNNFGSTELNYIDFNFIKTENILLQNEHGLQQGLKDKTFLQRNVDNEKSTSLKSTVCNNEVPDINDSELTVIKNNNINNSIIVKNDVVPIDVKKHFISGKNDFTSTEEKCYNFEANKDLNEIKQIFIASTDSDEIKTNNLEILNKQDKICGQCSMTFRYKRHLDRHLEGHQKNNCYHCNAKFARRKHLEVHLFRSHGERVTKYLHSCDVCSRSFLKRVLLNRHRAKHDYENGKVCSECGEMLKTEANDKEHKQNQCVKKHFKCKRCLQTFSIEQTYLTHIQNHDNHKCSECDVTFASKKKVYEHFKMIHSPKSDHNKVSNGVYFCTECRHTFCKKDDYTRHLESTSHLSKVNRELPIKNIFTCVICSKKLISQRALDQHIRRIHKGEKRFLCNIYGCTFQCARRTDLDRHKQLHIEQRNIVCEQCGKTFTSVSILNDHVLYVHNKERQFICEECGKAFKRNSLLKRHKLSHQQYRPFACIQCNTAFKRSHHLTRHMETCHRITLEKKKKVVKLMKTEDGHLVPIPEKPKKLKAKKVKLRRDSDIFLESDEKVQSSVNINRTIEYLHSDLELQLLSDSKESNKHSNLSLQYTNLLPVVNSMPQVLSLVDVNLEQVVTVEVTSPEALVTNDLIDQFETNCNEILSLSGYQDLEFQNGDLNTDQNFYDQTNYSELSLGNDGTSLLLDSNTSKIDSLPTIENYLNQSFPSFLNL